MATELLGELQSQVVSAPFPDDPHTTLQNPASKRAAAFYNQDDLHQSRKLVLLPPTLEPQHQGRPREATMVRKCLHLLQPGPPKCPLESFWAHGFQRTQS